jgi:hypothetical protein
MIVSKTQHGNERLMIEQTQIEKVETYKYLGTWVDDKNDQSREIKVRIETARQAFVKMKTMLTNRDLQLHLRLRALRCYIFSILLYGMEAWTLKKQHIRKIEAFEMWCYRRILKIQWVQRITNAEVLRRLNKELEIMNSIKRRKLEYLGHITRGEKYELLRIIMQGRIQGRRSIGRRRISWLKNLREWFNCSSLQLFRAAANKVTIAVMISNLR